jgi:hypothetical protein
MSPKPCELPLDILARLGLCETGRNVEPDLAGEMARERANAQRVHDGQIGRVASGHQRGDLG